ncbi:hypothetical protein [Sporosarcina psychrophila]|uniref:Virulence-protein E N-terminal domain-containing protein n=1 Tax=Sporosarcina psychrophila TaxID=1476 RepID=A0ABV2KDK4_SPOPS
MNTTIKEISNKEKFSVMLDSKMYSSKPNSSGAVGINNRIKDGLMRVTLEELADAIQSGRTFMPGTLKEKNGVLKRSKENWYSQQVVALDFDNGLTLKDALNDEYIRSNASFLYATFSHTEVANKFRIVFVLDRVVYYYTEITSIIEQLLNKYPQADKSCKDGSRLFYGGTNIQWFDENNRLDTEQILKESLGWDRENNIHISHPKTPAIAKSLKEKNPKNPKTRKALNIDVIKSGNIEELRERLDAPKVVLKRVAIEDYLKSQDLTQYLGVNRSSSILDIFHDEVSPSGSIFKVNNGSGHWLYKCHSESSPFVGSIIEVTKTLQGNSKKEAIEYLVNAFNIEIENREKVNAYRTKYHNYIEYLTSDDFEESYPNLYKVMTRGNSLVKLVQLLSFVSEYIDDREDIRIVSYHSINTLSKALDISAAGMGRKMNLYCVFGFINKLGEQEIDEKLLEKIKQNKASKNYKYQSTVYDFPILIKEELEEMERFSITWLESGLSIKTVTYEGIYRSFGEVEAERCFPQDKGKKISEMSSEVLVKLHRMALELIEEKGWTTQKEIINFVKVNYRNQKTLKEDTLKKGIKEMLDMYSLEILPLTKILKLELSITEEDMSIRSFPKIIRQIV